MSAVDYSAFHKPVAHPERYAKLSRLHLFVEFPLYGVQDIRNTFKSNANRLIPTYICLLRNDNRLQRKDFKHRTKLHESYFPDADAQDDDDFQKERAWLCCNRFDLGAIYEAGVGPCPAIKRFPSYNTFASRQLLADAPYMGQEEVENLLTKHHGSYHAAFMEIIALQLSVRTGEVKVALNPVAPLLRPLPCFNHDEAGEFVKELMWVRVHWLTYLLPPKKRNNVPKAGLPPAVKQRLVPSPVAKYIPDLPPNYFTRSEPAETDFLGQGGQGEVYRMTARQPAGLVAVKIQRHEPEDEDTITFKDRILKEWQIQQRLDHPNIVKIYNCFNKDGGHTALSVMPLMDFGSLQTFVISRSDVNPSASLPRPIIPEGSIAWICKEVCSGLDFIHHLGLRHGDVKAGNILLDTAGRVKLCDFGHTGKAAFGWPRTGTPEYWPPEAMSDERQRDVWALGIATRYMITGGLPLPPREMPKQAVMYGHLFKKFPPDMEKRYLHQISIAISGTRHLVPAYVDMDPDLIEFMCSTLDIVPARRLTTTALLKLPFVRKAHDGDELVKLISDITGDQRAVATAGRSAARMHPSATAPRVDSPDERVAGALEGPRESLEAPIAQSRGDPNETELMRQVEYVSPADGAQEQTSAAPQIVEMARRPGLSNMESDYCLKVPGAFTTCRAAEVSFVDNFSWDCVVLSIVTFILSVS